MGNGLAIGAGIAKAGENFTNAFIAARQAKTQDKLQKNAFIVQMLTRQLEDENLSYYDRAKILDSIPQLLGAKLDKPLSVQTGLDEFIKKEIEAGKPAIAGKEGTPDSYGPANEQGIAITKKGTQATPDIPATAPVMGGDLTPNLIKKKVALEIKRAENEQNTEQQKKLWEIQYRLQKEFLGRGGYNNELPGTFNEKGEYFVNMSNSEGDVKSVNLGKVTPDIIRKVEAGANRPSKELQQLEDKYINDGLSPEEANTKALEDIYKKFKTGVASKEAYVEGQIQRNTGTAPPTAATKTVDADRDRTYDLQLQSSFDEANAEAQSTYERMQKLSPMKQKAYDDYAKAENELKVLDPDDDEYKDKQAQVNRLRNEYAELEKEFRIVDQADILAKAKLAGATQRLQGRTGGTINYPDNIKRAIDKVRVNNPGVNLTDEQIFNVLKNAGKIR